MGEKFQSYEEVEKFRGDLALKLVNEPDRAERRKILDDAQEGEEKELYNDADKWNNNRRRWETNNKAVERFDSRVVDLLNSLYKDKFEILSAEKKRVRFDVSASNGKLTGNLRSYDILNLCTSIEECHVRGRDIEYAMAIILRENGLRVYNDPLGGLIVESQDGLGDHIEYLDKAGESIKFENDKIPTLNSLYNNRGAFGFRMRDNRSLIFSDGINSGYDYKMQDSKLIRKAKYWSVGEGTPEEEVPLFTMTREELKAEIQKREANKTE